MGSANLFLHAVSVIIIINALSVIKGSEKVQLHSGWTSLISLLPVSQALTGAEVTLNFHQSITDWCR